MASPAGNWAWIGPVSTFCKLHSWMKVWIRWTACQLPFDATNPQQVENVDQMLIRDCLRNTLDLCTSAMVLIQWFGLCKEFQWALINLTNTEHHRTLWCSWQPKAKHTFPPIYSKQPEICWLARYGAQGYPLQGLHVVNCTFFWPVSSNLQGTKCLWWGAQSVTCCWTGRQRTMTSSRVLNPKRWGLAGSSWLYSPKLLSFRAKWTWDNIWSAKLFHCTCKESPGHRILEEEKQLVEGWLFSSYCE